MCNVPLYFFFFSRKSIVRAHDVKILRSEKPKYGKPRSHDDQDYSSSSSYDGKKVEVSKCQVDFCRSSQLALFCQARFFPPSVYSAMWQIGSNKSRVRNGRIGGGREGFFLRLIDGILTASASEGDEKEGRGEAKQEKITMTTKKPGEGELSFSSFPSLPSIIFSSKPPKKNLQLKFEVGRPIWLPLCPQKSFVFLSHSRSAPKPTFLENGKPKKKSSADPESLALLC